MSDLIDREALLRQIGIDSEGEPGYYGDTWKFIDTIKSMPPAELSTNLAEVGTDAVSRQKAINALYEWECDNKDDRDAIDVINGLQTIQPKRGRWIDNGEAFICSECRSGYKEQPTLMGKPMFEFCPMCGAKMEGEQDG